jgi:hypothetical protein
MSALDDIAAAIAAIGDKIEEAGTATQAVDQEVDEASSTAAALGVDATVQALAQLSGELQSLAQQLGSAGVAAKQALETAHAVAEGT